MDTEREQALLKCIADLTEVVKKQSEILRNPPIIILRHGEELDKEPLLDYLKEIGK